MVLKIENYFKSGKTYMFGESNQTPTSFDPSTLPLHYPNCMIICKIICNILISTIEISGYCNFLCIKYISNFGWHIKM